MAKQIIPKVFIALWAALLLLLGLYYVFLAPRESEFTEDENRTLAGFPAVTAESVFSGRFGEEIETYLLDRFPARSKVIAATNRLQSLVSFASHDEYLLIAGGVDDALDAEIDPEGMEDLLAQFQNQATEPADTSTEPTEAGVTELREDPPIEPKPGMTPDDFPQNSAMFMDTGAGETAIQYYSRNNVIALTAVLNKYAATLPENGKLMFTIGPPSYIVNRFVNAEEKISFYCTWDDVINGLSADNVYAFDAAEILSEAIKEDKYVSFRTDNHWTPYGAYLVYSQMAARAGKTLCSYPDDFDITVEESFRGTYYRDNPSAYWNVEADTLEIVSPKIDVEYRKITGPDAYEVIDFIKLDASQRDRYTVYLGGPGGPWRYVQCDNEETENCLVVTDSFGLTVIPYLTSNYNQIHYYDTRFFSKAVVGYSVAEMIEQYNIQDIYVIIADFHSFSSGFLMTSANNDLNS